MGWILLAAMFIIGLVFGLAKTARRSSDWEEAERNRVQVSPEITKPPEATPGPKARYQIPLSAELQEYTVRICEERGVDPCIVFAIISVESEYQADAVGDEGHSYGLMQINRQWHEARMERLGVMDLGDPYQNIMIGVDIIAALLADGNGIEWALSYYNGNGGAPCEYARIVMSRAEQIAATDGEAQ